MNNSSNYSTPSRACWPSSNANIANPDRSARDDNRSTTIPRREANASAERERTRSVKRNIADKENVSPVNAKSSLIDESKSKMTPKKSDQICKAPAPKSQEIFVRFNSKEVVSSLSKRAFNEVLPSAEPEFSTLNKRFASLQDGDEDETPRVEAKTLNKLGWELDGEPEKELREEKPLYTYQDIKRLDLTGPLLSKLTDIDESNKHLLYNRVWWRDHLDSLRYCEQDVFNPKGQLIESKLKFYKIAFIGRLLSKNESLSASYLASMDHVKDVAFTPMRHLMSLKTKKKVPVKLEKQSPSARGGGKLVPNVLPVNMIQSNTVNELVDLTILDSDFLEGAASLLSSFEQTLKNISPELLEHDEVVNHLNTIPMPPVDNLVSNGVNGEAFHSKPVRETSKMNGHASSLVLEETHSAQTLTDLGHGIGNPPASLKLVNHHDSATNTKSPNTPLKKPNIDVAASTTPKPEVKSETRMRAEKLMSSDPRFSHYIETLAGFIVFMLVRMAQLNRLYFSYLHDLYEQSSCKDEARVRKYLAKLENKRVQLDRDIKSTRLDPGSGEGLKYSKFISEMLAEKLCANLLTTKSIFSDILQDIELSPTSSILSKPSIFDPTGCSQLQPRPRTQSLTSYVILSDFIDLIIDFHSAFKRLKERFISIEQILTSKVESQSHAAGQFGECDFSELIELKLQFHDLLSCLLSIFKSNQDKSTIDAMLFVLKPVELLIVDIRAESVLRDPRTPTSPTTETQLHVIPSGNYGQALNDKSPLSSAKDKFDEIEYVRTKYFKSPELDQLQWSPLSNSETKECTKPDSTTKESTGDSGVSEDIEDDVALLESFAVHESHISNSNSSNGQTNNDTLMIPLTEDIEQTDKNFGLPSQGLLENSETVATPSFTRPDSNMSPLAFTPPPLETDLEKLDSEEFLSESVFLRHIETHTSGYVTEFLKLDAMESNIFHSNLEPGEINSQYGVTDEIVSELNEILGADPVGISTTTTASRKRKEAAGSLSKSPSTSSLSESESSFTSLSSMSQANLAESPRTPDKVSSSTKSPAKKPKRSRSKSRSPSPHNHSGSTSNDDFYSP